MVLSLILALMAMLALSVTNARTENASPALRSVASASCVTRRTAPATLSEWARLAMMVTRARRVMLVLREANASVPRAVNVRSA